MKNITSSIKRIADNLTKLNYKISVAESCTGGLISKLLTDRPGSSKYFDRGFITYSNLAKQQMLGVPPEIITKYGAVSERCAKSMVLGVYENSKSDICISITGIAGPDGGTLKKPVGTVFMGFLIKKKCVVIKKMFKGSRTSIRNKTAEFCLNYISDVLERRSF